MKRFISLSFLSVAFAAMFFSSTACQRFPASETVLEDGHGGHGKAEHAVDDGSTGSAHAGEEASPTYFPDKKAD
ncbi:MAG: hypothetical protein ACK5LK_09525 [Chthoniobacterales bacterium]